MIEIDPKLRERAEYFTGPCMSGDPGGLLAIIRDLLSAIDTHDAQPGWIDGPPKEEGWFVYITHSGKKFGNWIHTCDLQAHRYDRCHYHTPPPPKPVVSCCEMGSNNYVLEKVNWRLRECSFYCLTHCQWCGTKLPELGVNDE